MNDDTLYTVDVSNMKQFEMKRYVENITAKLRYNISDKENAIDLRKYSQTTQILIKSKFELQYKDWMGYDSKVFFRLWRFVYRSIQREHGYEDDITEYDEFIRKWKILRIEGDYVITESKEKSPQTDSDLFNKRVKEQGYKSDRIYKDLMSQYNNSPTQITGYQVHLIQSWKGCITSDHRTMDKYLGVSVKDEQTMQGLYNVLMAYDIKLSREQFKDRWNTLGIINATEHSSDYYWGSRYGHIYNSIMDANKYQSYFDPNNHNPGTTHCDVETIVTELLDNDKKYKFNFTHNMWKRVEEDIVEFKQQLKSVNRRDYNPFEEFVFRYLYFFSYRHGNPRELMKLHIQPNKQLEQLSEYEREAITAYRNKVRTLIETPTPPFTYTDSENDFTQVGPYQIKNVS